MEINSYQNLLASIFYRLVLIKLVLLLFITLLVYHVPDCITSIKEYLLLSETADEKPSLLLPNALDNRPRLDLPLDVREEAKIQTRPPGVGYVLVCDLPPSVPYNAPIKWYKNGVAYDVPNSGRVSLLDNGRVLQFQTLKREDGGLYSCVAGKNLALYASRIVIAPGPANGKLTSI